MANQPAVIDRIEQLLDDPDTHVQQVCLSNSE